jgi:hypothetical protein
MMTNMVAVNRVQGSLRNEFAASKAEAKRLGFTYNFTMAAWRAVGSPDPSTMTPVLWVTGAHLVLESLRDEYWDRRADLAEGTY